MFKEIKDTIKDLAYSAVYYAEEKLNTGTGQEKKRFAVNFIVNRLALPEFLKPFLIFVLSSFIDNSIEKAVEYLNQVQNED